MTLNIMVYPEMKPIRVSSGTRIADCLDVRCHTLEQNVVAARMGNVYSSLMDSVTVNCELKPIGINEPAGVRIYRNSLVFLFEYVVSQHFSDRNIVIGHSIGHEFFYRIRDKGPPLSESDILKMGQTMQELVSRNLPIIPENMSWMEAVTLFEQQKYPATLLLLQDLNESLVRTWRCGSHIALRHGPLVRSTGILTAYSIEPYRKGLRLRCPSSHSFYISSGEDDAPQLYAVYEEHKRWGDILGIPNVARLNTLARNRREAREYILTAEALHDRKISEVAAMITGKSNGTQAVMIAGPSSSGKTTFTKKLALNLKSSGFQPELISLDDYYREREHVPKDENNKPNLEALDALDIPLLNEHLHKLLIGKEVEIPIFDFKKTGGRLPNGRPICLGENSILLLEGIHALNPDLIFSLESNDLFRIYISALTSLNIEDHVRIPATDNRLIRRIVRDHQFRRYHAIDTLRMWPSVRKGEEKYIFPWQKTADVMFNSALDYELSILKVFAQPLLRTVSPRMEEYGEARRLMDLLHNFSSFPVEEVPQFSILREFIGRSGFRY